MSDSGREWPSERSNQPKPAPTAEMLPLTCVGCNRDIGPLYPVGEDCAGWMCDECYTKSTSPKEPAPTAEEQLPPLDVHDAYVKRNELQQRERQLLAALSSLRAISELTKEKLERFSSRRVWFYSGPEVDSLLSRIGKLAE